MQTSFLEIMEMAVSIGMFIAPYALLRSLDTPKSRILPIIALLTGACVPLDWSLALSFFLAAFLPALAMHILHKRESVNNSLTTTNDNANISAGLIASSKAQPYKPVSWMSVVLAPVPACIALLIFVAMYYAGAISEDSTLLNRFYQYGASITGLDSPSPELVKATAEALIRSSVSLLYVLVGIVFYFTERFYYHQRIKDDTPVIMHLPDFFIGLLLASLALSAVPHIFSSMDEGTRSLCSAIGSNGVTIVAMVYCFRGLDIAKYYFLRWRLLPFLIGLIYFMILIFWPLTTLVSILGFVSVYKNLLRE
jgi:hypothetical protein